jgi:hypothetical protein
MAFLSSRSRLLASLLSWLQASVALVLLLSCWGLGEAGAAPLAGNVVLRRGQLTQLRGRSLRSRLVKDYASLELGDVLRLEEKGVEADVTTFDSGILTLDGVGAYRIMRDGIYRQVPNGKLRVFQFSLPLGVAARARQIEVMQGSLGTLKPAGEVWLRRSGSRKWREIFRDTEVRYHDRIRTGSEGMAVLRYDSRSALVFESDAKASFQKDRVNLEAGSLLTNWRRRGMRFEVHTPASVVVAQGAVFRVSMSRPGAQEKDRVECFEGRVQVGVRGGRGGQTLSEGNLARVLAASRSIAAESFLLARKARSWAKTLRKQLKDLPRKSTDRAAALRSVLGEMQQFLGDSEAPAVKQAEPGSPSGSDVQRPDRPRTAPPAFAALTPPASSISNIPVLVEPRVATASASIPAPSRGTHRASRAPNKGPRSIPAGQGRVQPGGWVVNVEKAPGVSRDKTAGRFVPVTRARPPIPTALPPKAAARPPMIQAQAPESARVPRRDAMTASRQVIPAPPPPRPPEAPKARSVTRTPPAPRPPSRPSASNFDLDPLGGPVSRRGRRSIDLARAFRL